MVVSHDLHHVARCKHEECTNPIPLRELTQEQNQRGHQHTHWEANNKQRYWPGTPAGHAPACVTCDKTMIISPPKKGESCSRNNIIQNIFFGVKSFTKYHETRNHINNFLTNTLGCGCFGQLILQLHLIHIGCKLTIDWC